MNLIILLMFMFQAHFAAPVPVDVPPVTEEYGNLGYQYCDMGNCVWVDGVPPGFDHTGDAPAYKRRTRLTCADKTRFLMTSEDGKGHCIRLGGGGPAQ